MSIKKHIPNSITCMNLLSGAVAITMAFDQQYLYASLFIYLAAVFDFFDGMSARLLHVSSPIGKELDSLADDVSFGLAPGVVLYNFAVDNATTSSNLLPFFCFIISAFSALRLAKFNLDERQTTSFIGLATPAMTILTVGTIALFDPLIADQYNTAWLAPAINNIWVLLIYVAVMSWLMISEIPMFSLKFHDLKWKGNEPRFILLIAGVVFLVIFQLAAIPLIMLLYIIMSLIIAIKNRVQK